MVIDPPCLAAYAENCEVTLIFGIGPESEEEIFSLTDEQHPWSGPSIEIGPPINPGLVLNLLFVGSPTNALLVDRITLVHPSWLFMTIARTVESSL